MCACLLTLLICGIYLSPFKPLYIRKYIRNKIDVKKQSSQNPEVLKASEVILADMCEVVCVQVPLKAKQKRNC